MKNILYSTLIATVMCLPLSAQTISNMNELKPQQKADAKELKLTGKLTTQGNSDFRQLRDLCYQLHKVDLSGADCEVVPNNAFHSRHALQSILLPDNVKSIGSQAFFACTSLTQIELPQSLTRVGDAAFSSCSALKEITIKGTPTLGEFAFARLSGLRTVRVTSDVPPVAVASTFEGINRKKVKLIVPKGAELRYRKAPGWNLFFSEPDNTTNKVCDPTTVLVPLPVDVQVRKGSNLSLEKVWEVMAAEGLANECLQAEQLLRTRLPKLRNPKLAGKATLTLGLDPSLKDDEAYTLDVTEKGVSIHGKTATGVFYGLMTFDQLMRGNGTTACCEAIPQLHITDQPRTHIRELMVDPCRTFIPFNELKAFIPEMARYKYNTIHLHLTDDQAWRIEIKKYPQLTQQASSRVGMDDMLVPISGLESAALAKQICKRLKMDRKRTDAIVALIAAHEVQLLPQRTYLLRMLRKYGAVQAKRLLALRKADLQAQVPAYAERDLQKLEQMQQLLQELLQEQACFQLKDLAIRGNDLLAMGIPKGVLIGKLLQDALEQVIRGKLPNEREALLQWVQERWNRRKQHQNPTD